MNLCSMGRRRINMTGSNWTEADSNRAKQIWSDYEHHYALSEKAGQTAGIDPASGRIWFGESIQDVIAQRDAASSEAPLVLRACRLGSLLPERAPPLIAGIVTEDGVPAIEVEAGGERWQAII